MLLKNNIYALINYGMKKLNFLFNFQQKQDALLGLITV